MVLFIYLQYLTYDCVYASDPTWVGLIFFANEMIMSIEIQPPGYLKDHDMERGSRPYSRVLWTWKDGSTFDFTNFRNLKMLKIFVVNVIGKNRVFMLTIKQNPLQDCILNKFLLLICEQLFFSFFFNNQHMPISMCLVQLSSGLFSSPIPIEL